MVSYYNALPYSQKHSANIPYPPSQSWFTSNYHAPPNHPYLNDADPSGVHGQHMYYSPHVFHPSSPDWVPAHEGYQQQQSSSLLQNHGVPAGIHASHSAIDASITEGLPSPPITVSGSEVSSPGAPNGAPSPHIGPNHNNNNSVRLTSNKSPYYDWMKKPSYVTQPNPGKTRTKDKYRVVYTDFQRLELEKEYHTARYITIRRKTELAQTLQLSERQVKIWFQNRRAKERKQTKKRDDPLVGTLSHQHSQSQGILNMIEAKPKIDNLHLQHHPLHQMSSMAMGIPGMSIHHHSVLHHHGHIGVPPSTTPSQHLHQPHSLASGAAAGPNSGASQSGAISM